MSSSDTNGAPSHEPTEANWPAGVRGISFDQIGRLGVGQDNSLYWGGKPVVTRKSVTLTLSQKIGAFAVAMATVITAVAACFTAYAAIMSIPAQRTQTSAAKSPAHPLVSAPPCPQGKATCEPWERAWNSDTMVKPGQAVTNNGLIVDGQKR